MQTVNEGYSATVVGDTYSDKISIERAETLSIQTVVDVDTPSAVTFDSGEAEVTTITFEAKADTDPGDYVVIPDTDGNLWAISLDVAGSDPEPTGDVWASIPAGRKVHVDISGTTTAASVAAAVETAFDALTGLPFTTDDSGADGTFVVTQTVRGPIETVAVYNEDDSGNGGITFAQTNEGVASEVNATDDTITIPTHGLTTGLKGQVTKTGTHVDGLQDTTDYFVIVVDDDTIQLASSLSNALAGTAIDLLDQGSDGNVSTFTPTSLAGASVTYQKSNVFDPQSDSDWSDVAQATSITQSGSTWYEPTTPVCWRWLRLKYTLTAGRMSVDAYIVGKS